MIKAKQVRAELRRDAAYIVKAIIAIVFVSFATLAVAAAVFDVFAIEL
jgi:hypothetical protein